MRGLVVPLEPDRTECLFRARSPCDRGRPATAAPAAPAATEGALGPVAVAGGSIFLINDEAKLVRLDAATGEVIWSVAMPYFTKEKIKKRKGIFAHYGPVLAGGRVMVVSSDGLLRAFDPTDGSLTYTAEIPGGAAAQPAVAGGTLYVVGGSGQLHAFR